MDTKLFEQFAQIIRSLSDEELAGSRGLDAKLGLAKDGKIEVCYTPFEYVNPQARIVIVGITPGRTQLVNAIKEARRQLDRGASAREALIAAKKSGAFSGEMRKHLVSMLDHVGIQHWLGIPSADDLFGASSNLVQTTSVLRHAVFVDGENYNGTPKMTSHRMLQEQLLSHFGEEARALTNASCFVPLGDKVAEALHYLADKGLLDRRKILEGLSHPSPANIERINYFLGRKERSKLSKKTNPDKIDHALTKARSMVHRLANA